MNKNILITGGTGFIGKNLYSYLESKKYNLFLLIQDFEKTKIKSENKKAILWESLINDEEIRDIYNKKIPKIDIVIHLASYGVNNIDDDLNKMMEVNINLSVQLIKNLYKINCKKIIFTGTALEYKNKFGKLKEEDAICGNTLYSSTKSAGILLSDALAKKLGIETITLRLFNIFGEYENENKLLQFLFKSKDKVEIPFSKGEQIKDFLYIKDLLFAYEKVLIKNIFDGEIYNICSGEGISIKDFILLSANIINISPDFLKFGKYEYRIGEPMYIVGDNSKFSSKFEWAPLYTLEKGIELTYETYLKEVNLIKEDLDWN